MVFETLESLKKELYEKVKDLDIYKLMLLEILDHADWLVTEYTKLCQEEAEKKSRGDKNYFKVYFTNCLYETKDEIRANLVRHVNHVVEAARILFEKFYNYDLPPGLEEFYLKVNKIIQEALRRFYPYEIPITH